MKRFHWQLFLVIFLLGLSAFFYLLQIELFHKLEDTAFYFFQDLAFVPIQVLLVTLIINQVLAVREKKATLRKLNMIIGVFYNEIGTPLLNTFINWNPGPRRSKKNLWVQDHWSKQQFSKSSKLFKRYKYQVEIRLDLLEEIRAFLMTKREIMLRLLENPNLLEHDAFTDMMLAVFHLHDELASREALSGAAGKRPGPSVRGHQARHAVGGFGMAVLLAPSPGSLSVSLFPRGQEKPL